MAARTKHVGHVFVVYGDITKLSCDHYGIPMVNSNRISQRWYPDKPVGAPNRCEMHGAIGIRGVEDWPENMPRPWIINLDSDASEVVVLGDRYRTAAARMGHLTTRFLNSVAKFIQDHPEKKPLHGRPVHLAAIPVLGTGGGGLEAAYGFIVAALLDSLLVGARKHGFDVALVCWESPVYAAAIAQREKMGHQEVWGVLAPHLQEDVKRLAALASIDKLSIFMGAGVSKGAGLPLWGSLLASLEKDYCKLTPREQKTIGKWDVMDRARLVEKRLGRKGLVEALQKMLRSTRHSLAHALLAALDIQGFVTTNYDQLFEMAANVSGKVCVLPYEQVNKDTKRFLLKLHGCLAHPSDIVLTRNDYQEFEHRRSALGGILSSLLLTKSSMLFVGFSMSDPNFLRIIQAVRKAVDIESSSAVAPPTTSSSGPSSIPERARELREMKKKWKCSGCDHMNEPRSSMCSVCSTPFALGELHLGTAIQLIYDPLMEELWKDLKMVSISKVEEPTGSDFSEASRTQEIMLDALQAWSCNNTRHLMKVQFQGALSAEELKFRDLLTQFMKKIPKSCRKTAAYREFRELLIRFGEDMPERREVRRWIPPINLATMEPPCVHLVQALFGDPKNVADKAIEAKAKELAKACVHTHCNVCGEKAKETEHPDWLCVSCLHVGCGRFVHSHAMAHANTKKHPISVCLKSQVGFWCYECDKYVPHTSYVQITDAIKRQLEGNGGDDGGDDGSK